MDIEQAWTAGLTDFDEPAVWEDDDELTLAELATLHALDGAPAGAGGLAPAGGESVADLVAAALGAAGDPGLMSDAELVGALADWHAVAARAQGRELGVTAELLRRRPPRKWDRRSDRAQSRREDADGASPGEPGCPGRAVPVVAASREAAEEIALALTVTGYAAWVQAELAADLVHRLPVAFGELRAGRADLTRVKVLAEATQFLSDEDAGKVDALLSPRLGELTTGALKDKARRAIIKIDPAAAERRRERAERKARFVLYGNEDQTATVAVERMPAQLAAAAKARVNAIARAAKAAGMAGPLALLEAKVATGLLLDILPLIPPPDGGEDADGSGTDPSGPGGLGPHDGGPDSGQPDAGNPDGDSGPVAEGWDAGWPANWPAAPGHPADGDVGESDPDVPDLSDPEPLASEPDCGHDSSDPDDDPEAQRGSLPWPDIPVRAGAGGPGSAGLPAWLRPKAGGRLRLAVPWRTLAGLGPEPGELSWTGPITPAQARQLAAAAAVAPNVTWRLIVTDDEGHALTVTTLRTRRGTGSPGLVSEVTVTIQQSLAAALAAEGGVKDRIGRSLADIDAANIADANFGKLAALLAAAIPAANAAAAEAAAQAALDAAAGGCAHAMEAAGYRVPDKLRRWITARDRTCRSPVCRQPAARCDQDHTRAYDHGGRTCSCGLGSLCRVHHQLKQLPGWHLAQDARGRFTWTTPAGLTYHQEPHCYSV